MDIAYRITNIPLQIGKSAQLKNISLTMRLFGKIRSRLSVVSAISIHPLAVIGWKSLISRVLNVYHVCNGSHFLTIPMP